MTMFDELFGESLEQLNKAEDSVKNKNIGPFVNGCDLDWNDEELVNELMGSEMGAEPQKLRRV